MQYKYSKQSGFTLIEILIVVAIIGIISAIAYPSYMEQVRKSRRADAKIALQQLAQRQESYFIRHYKYSSSAADLNASLTSPEGYYSMAISLNNSDRGYTLTATPSSNSPQQYDSTCASFTLTNTGQKTAKSSSNVIKTDTCWH